MDLLGRPIGDVFNIHPEYTRIFVGGFPFEGDDRPRIQVCINWFRFLSKSVEYWFMV